MSPMTRNELLELVYRVNGGEEKIVSLYGGGSTT